MNDVGSCVSVTMAVCDGSDGNRSKGETWRDLLAANIRFHVKDVLKWPDAAA